MPSSAEKRVPRPMTDVTHRARDGESSGGAPAETVLIRDPRGTWMDVTLPWLFRSVVVANGSKSTEALTAAPAASPSSRSHDRIRVLQTAES